VINFIAVEPIPAGTAGRRGLSELERSARDGVPGKRMWSVDEEREPPDPTPRSPQAPARGRIVTLDGGVQTLRVFVPVERFDNGAHVYLRLTFRTDRPHEVAIASFARDDSAKLDRCILTATMGNFARLRELRLAGRTVTAGSLWPDYRGDGFAPHARFPLDELSRGADGAAVVSATPTEPNPDRAEYADGTRQHWRYVGRPAVQSWRCEAPDPELRAAVNGRVVYWASHSPIPGGIAFENFEMDAPFRQGQEFVFAVEPLEVK
jgi:hypothetical protein